MDKSTSSSPPTQTKNSQTQNFHNHFQTNDAGLPLIRKDKDDFKDNDYCSIINSQQEINDELPNHSNSSNNDNKNTSILRMPKKSLCILFLCTLANFLSGCSFSLMAPFYSTEARNKGMSSALVGIMFSVYQFVIFIFSPIFGNYLTQIGPKFIHLSSMFVGCTTTVLFGLLHLCPPGELFVLLSFLCRTFQAIGYCGFMAASFAIVASEFPDRVATVYGIAEAGNTIGYMIGPLFGGILYDVGGFQMPFYVVSGLVFINGAFMYRYLPTLKHTNGKKRKTSALYLLKSPMVIVPALSVTVGAIGIKYLEPTLANHLAPFDLSPSLIGLIFFIEPLLSSTSCPFWGYMSDVRDTQGPIICMGHFILSVAFFMAGPTVPGLKLEIWTVVVSQLLVGLAYECTIIPTMKCMVTGALEIGLADNIETYGLVCGMFNSVYYLGGAVGPLIGGLFSYSSGTAFLGFLNAAVVVLCVVFFLRRKWSKMKRSISQEEEEKEEAIINTQS